MKILKSVLPVLVIMVLIVWTGCKKDDDDNTVIASFTYELTEIAGEVVFTNQSSNAQIFQWNFGDGSSHTTENPTHVYDKNESYIVILTATGDGTSNTFQDTVVVDNIPLRK